MKDPTLRKPKYEEIVTLAYQFYENDGRVDGKDLEHWFRAESQLIEALNPRAASKSTAATKSFKSDTARRQNASWFKRSS